MTRTGLALAIVSCFPGAAFAATSSPPPSFNVKVTNPVLPVEIRNANPCQRRSNSDPPFGLNAEVKLTHLGT